MSKIQQRLKEIASLAKHTPDWFELKKKDDDLFLVFVYDQTQSGHIKKEVLKGCPYFGRGTTISAFYMLKEQGPDKGPVGFYFDRGLTKGNRKIEDHCLTKIRGEVYAVPLRVLSHLDLINCNGQIFNRDKSFITLNNQKDSPTHQCFMYKGNSDYFPEHKISAMPNCAKIILGQEKYSYF